MAPIQLAIICCYTFAFWKSLGGKKKKKKQAKVSKNELGPGNLTPSGKARQHTALTNSLVSSSFLSLSRTLFTVSNLKVSNVLESPL